MNTSKTILFILLYYLVWFLSIYFAFHHRGYAALSVSIMISFIQTTFFITKNNLKPFIIWLLAFSLLGYFIDTLFQIYGLLKFKSNPWGEYFAPPWILALWINFSVLCFGMNRLLIKYIKYMPLLALCGFPLAYSAGIKFGVATYIHPILSPLTQGLIWAIIFSVCVFILKRHHKIDHEDL